MVRTLKITNYRCFKNFYMEKLGRVNLLIGRNNSGKTRVLETIGLLLYQTPFAITLSSKRRPEPDIHILNSLFHGFHFEDEQEFHIGSNRLTFRLKVRRFKDSTFNTEKNLEIIGQNLLKIGQKSNGRLLVNTNSRSYGFDGSKIHYFNAALNSAIDANALEETVFLGTDSILPDNAIVLFNKFSLTNKEPIIIEALKILEPRTARIVAGNLDGK